MKYCPNCGSKAEDEDCFCMACGKAFNSSASHEISSKQENYTTPQSTSSETIPYVPPVQSENLSWKDKGGCAGIVIRLFLVVLALCIIGVVIWAIDSSFGVNKSLTEFINDAIPVSCSTVIVRV